MKKIGLLALGLALALGVVAEAGSIPADRVPLQTYAVKKLNCYLQPNGVQKGWIDPGDYVVVTQIRSDGWAYGSYPVGNGKVSRWFRADDLVNNIGFANQERYSPKANTYTYTNPNHNKQFGSFNDNEPILVVSDSGQSRQFIYKVNGGGYKMAWAPYWDCWDARQAGKQQVNNNVINKNPIMKPVQREDKKQEQTSYGVWKATARYTANTYDNPDLRGARAGWITNGSDIEVLGENAKSYFIRYWADNGAKRERYVERTAVKGLNEDKENKKQVNNNRINTNPIVKPVQREDKKQEQSSSYGVWKATARYTANTYDNPDLRGMRAGRVTSGSDIEVLGENAKSYFIRYWADNGAKRERYVERTAVKGLNEDKENKKQVNNNRINTNPIVKPVQREDKKQEQSSSYGVWKATARYTANTYDNPDLRGMRAGRVTSGSDIEVLGENAKSYFIRYWADNGAKRERYVERTAVKGLNEDKDNKKQVNSNTINTNPIVKPVQREEKKQSNNLSCGCSNSYAGNYIVNTSRLPLTMRSGHGSNYGKVTSIPKGTTVTVSASNGTWAHVNYNGSDGYASMQYLKKVEEGSISTGLIKGIEGSISKSNASTSIVQQKIESLYAQHYKIAQKGNCYYFAKGIFNKLFGALVNGINNGDNTYLDGYSNAYIIKKVHDANYVEGKYKTNIPVNSNYIAQIKEAFLLSKPGCFVQMALRKKANSKGDCGSPHSAIIYKIDNEGVTFYEANWTRGQVTITNKQTWNSFAQNTIGFTIYAPNNYRLK